MGQSKNIAIVGAYPYNGNRGVGALALATLYLLKEVERENNITYNYFLINPEFGSKKTDSFTFQNESISVTNQVPFSFLGLKSIIKLLLDPKQLKALAQYLKFDFILNMGAGDSFADIYGTARFNTVNDQNRMAFFFNKKLCLLPQTIGPFKDKKVHIKAVKSINKASLVFPRDAQSYKFTQTNSRQSELHEVIDVAFFLPFTPDNFEGGFIHVGLNISALLYYGGYTRNDQFNLKVDYQKLIDKIISYFLSIPNLKLHLIPHVVGQQQSVENDYSVSLDVLKKYNSTNLILAPFFLDAIQAKNYIAGLDFFAGARMHSTIAAFSSGVPVFPMAYSRKFNGLFAETLNYAYMGDMLNQEEDLIIAKIKDAFNNRSELSQIVKDRIDTTVKERKNIILNKLKAFLQ